MKLFFKKSYQHILVLVVVIATTAFFVYQTYLATQLFPAGELPNEMKRTISLAMVVSFLSLVGATVWVVYGEMKRLQNTQNWLIDAVNWNIERLKAHGLCRLPDDHERSNESENVSRWPWGLHHTVYLGHLEAAARKWWNLYDPSDPTTAPTNEIVSDWLQSERNVSRERARAIASMLRPDGLPTGPRR